MLNVLLACMCALTFWRNVHVRECQSLGYRRLNHKTQRFFTCLPCPWLKPPKDNHPSLFSGQPWPCNFAWSLPHKALISAPLKCLGQGRAAIWSTSVVLTSPALLDKSMNLVIKCCDSLLAKLAPIWSLRRFLILLIQGCLCSLSL